MMMQVVKRVAAQHRLVLSGTPIQNSVLELWALFDFLMPGFLGTAAEFRARYGRALAALKGSSLGSAAAQAGLLALDGLHKQVLLWRLPCGWSPSFNFSLPTPLHLGDLQTLSDPQFPLDTRDLCISQGVLLSVKCVGVAGYQHPRWY